MLNVIRSYKYLLGFAFTIASIVVLLCTSPIPQDLSYHHFADDRLLFGIHNFLNVISNIAFIVVGCLGLLRLFTNHKVNFLTSAERLPYGALFIGLILTGLGSAYYHLNPNNSTLLWDRLPMCIIFMSCLSAIFMERVNKRIGLFLLFPLIIIGMLGALYWGVSELLGHGDLRFYGWVQFYPITMISLMLLLFSSTYTGTRYIVEAFCWYSIAKSAEFFDKDIYALTLHAVSGHTIKHLAAALSIYSIIRYLKYRRPVPNFLHPN